MQSEGHRQAHQGLLANVGQREGDERLRGDGGHAGRVGLQEHLQELDSGLGTGACAGVLLHFAGIQYHREGWSALTAAVGAQGQGKGQGQAKTAQRTENSGNPPAGGFPESFIHGCQAVPNLTPARPPRSLPGRDPLPCAHRYCSEAAGTGCGPCYKASSAHRNSPPPPRAA